MRKLFFLLFVLSFVPVQGVLKVKITKGVFSPIPIAIAKLDAEDKEIADSLRDVISADLGGSGLFSAIPKGAHPKLEFEKEGIVKRQHWQAIKADGLVYGSVSTSGSTIKASVKLIDVFAPSGESGEVITITVSRNKSEWRRLAHEISDKIYERLTGEVGYFNTKFAYVSESGPADKRMKRLAIADYDGANYRLLTSGRALVMTPRFSKSANKIAYYSVVNRKGNIYILDLNSNSTELLGQFDGLSHAPRFSEDGTKVLFSLAKGMYSHIHEMDLRTRKKTRLTTVPALNTSPYYSPDGANIVFVSNRSGTPQLYVMDRAGEGSGTSAKRLTYAAGSRYFTPVFSPNGKYLAFTKIHIPTGQFYVGIMKPDGSGERTLAQGFFVEAPTWSPNSQMIMYTRRTPINKKTRSDVARLYMIHINGTNEKEVLTPTDAADPEWSAHL
jgi:TolB protein